LKEYFKYNTELLKPLIGKRITNVFFKEDFRYPNGSSGYFEPYYNRFSGIQNLGIWYCEEDQHYTLKFYCVRNGRFAIKEDDKSTHYGIRSIGIKSNDDLNYRKLGSIYLSPAASFGINVNNEIIKKITLQQELREEIYEENKGKTIYPKLNNSEYFPDRIIIEGDDLYMLIRAEEDYDQNLHLKLNVGFKFKDKSDYLNGLTEPDNMKIITLETIE